MPRQRRIVFPHDVLLHVERANAVDAVARLAEKYVTGRSGIEWRDIATASRAVHGIIGTVVSRTPGECECDELLFLADRYVTWTPEAGLPGVWRGVRNGRALALKDSNGDDREPALRSECERAAEFMRAARARFAASVAAVEARHAAAARCVEQVLGWTPDGWPGSIKDAVFEAFGAGVYDTVLGALIELSAGAWRDRAAMIHGPMRLEYEAALSAALELIRDARAAGEIVRAEPSSWLERNWWELALSTEGIEYEAWLRRAARGPMLAPIGTRDWETWMRAADSPGLADSAWATPGVDRMVSFEELLAIRANGGNMLDAKDKHRLRIKAGRGGAMRGAPEATLGAFVAGLLKVLEALSDRDAHMPVPPRVAIAARLIEYEGRDVLNRGGQITLQAIAHAMRRATGHGAAATAQGAEIAAILARLGAAFVSG